MGRLQTDHGIHQCSLMLNRDSAVVNNYWDWPTWPSDFDPN